MYMKLLIAYLLFLSEVVIYIGYYTFHTLSRIELCLLLNQKVYSIWQQAWECSYTNSITRFFPPLVKEKASFPLDLNFFLTQDLIGHDCLREYLAHLPPANAVRNSKVSYMYCTTIPASMTYGMFSEFHQKHMFFHIPSLNLLGW